MSDIKDFNISSGDYDLDNFDVDGGYEITDNPADYGDNFDSQTGTENQSGDGDVYHDGYSSDNTTDIYSSSGYADSRREKAKNKIKKKKHSNRTVAIIMTVAAAICLIIAMVFALNQCSGNTDNTAAASSAVTTAQQTTAQTAEEPQIYVEAEHTFAQPDTEANVATVPPAEAVTVPPTQAPVQTEPPATQIATEPLTEPQTEAPAETVAPAEGDGEEENTVAEENFD